MASVASGLGLYLHGIGAGAAAGLFVLKAGDTMTGSLLPTPTGALNLGSATLAWGTVFGRTFRADNDQTATLRSIQVGAGAGNPVRVIGASGVGGANIGGDVVLTPGAGVGAGARGNIIFDDGGGAINVLPTTTNLVTLGSATLGLVNVFTRALRPDNDQALAISTVRVAVGAGDGITITAANGAAGGTGGPITLTTGAAFVGSGLAGGDLIFAPGAGDGAGTRGLIRITATTTTALRPDTTNVVSLGQAALAFSTAFARALRPDNDQTLAISTVQVAAGAGPNITITASAGIAPGAGGSVTVTGGAGVGAGANLGGSITLTTGAGSGAASGSVVLTTATAGASRGVIRLDDQAAALSVLPTTTNLVTLGSATLAFSTTFTRILRADDANNLLINYTGGATWATVGASAPAALGQTRMGDGIDFIWGSGSDVRVNWSTASANNAFVFTTGVNTAAQSGNIIFTTLANQGNEHGLAAVATPQLAIFSAADMSVAANRNQHLRIRHDGSTAQFVTNRDAAASDYVFQIQNAGAFAGDVLLSTNNSVGAITLRAAAGSARFQLLNAGDNRIVSTNAGASGLTIRENSNLLYTFIGQVNGVVCHSLAQPVNTSGTPTGLLWTSGPHTTLAAGVESLDVNWNLTATAQFATGALATQRSFLIQNRTYGFVGASTVTNCATVAIVGSPIQGANATFTSALAFWVQNGGQGGFNTYFGTTPSMGGGIGCIGIANAGTNPASNPTAGGILYSNAGAGTWRGSGGTVTAFGPAGPHCGRCGYDFWTVASRNDHWGAHLYVCGMCGAEFKRGPASVLERLTAEQRREILA